MMVKFRLATTLMAVASLAAATSAALAGSGSTPTPFAGYDDSNSNNAANPTFTNSLIAETAFKNAATAGGGVFYSYQFGNVQLTNGFSAIGNGTGGTSTFGDTNFTGTAASWSVPSSSYGNLNTSVSGANVTNETALNGTPYTNGAPMSSGGSYLFLSPGSSTGTVTLTFNKAVNGAGFFLAGVGNQGGTVTITTNTGLSYTVKGSEDNNTSNSAGPNNNAGMAFYGFTSNNVFTSITISDATHADKFSIAGIDYTIVPEPGTYVAFIAGALMIVMLIRRRNARGNASFSTANIA